MLFDFDESIHSVKYHSYRTAMVQGSYIDINRDCADARILEGKLAKAAGVRGDNHVVYEITATYGNEKNAPLYVWCSDSFMRIGTKIVEDNW